MSMYHFTENRMPLKPFPWDQLPDLKHALAASFWQEDSRILFALRTIRIGDTLGNRIAEFDTTTGTFRDVGPPINIVHRNIPLVAFSRPDENLTSTEGLSGAALDRFEALRNTPYVAFETRVALLPEDNDNASDVYLLDTGSGELHLVDSKLLDDTKDIYFSAFSTDGSALGLLQTGTATFGYRHAVTVNTITGSAIDLTALLDAAGYDTMNDDRVLELALSGNGDRVLALLRGGRPVLFDISTGTLRDLTVETTGVFVGTDTAIGRMRNPIFSNDGTEIFYWASMNSIFGASQPQGLYRFGIDSGLREMLIAAGNGGYGFYDLSLSENDRYLAFRSAEPGIVATDMDALPDNFILDLQTGEASLVGAAMEGGKPWASGDMRPVISADATRMVVGSQDLRLLEGLEKEAQGFAYLVNGEGAWLPSAAEVSISIIVRHPGGSPLADVDFQISGADGKVVARTGEDGSVTFTLPAGFVGSIGALRDYAIGDPAITAADALETLRLAVGLNLSHGPATARDFVAADFNGDGAVTAADALEILRHAVGLDADGEPRWVFAESATLENFDGTGVPELAPISLFAATADSSIDVSAILVGRLSEFG